MLPEAKYYGVDIATVSKFVRNAFQGKKIMTIQRGRDEVEVILENAWSFHLDPLTWIFFLLLFYWDSFPPSKL